MAQPGARPLSTEPTHVPPEVLDRIAHSYVGTDGKYTEEVESVVPSAAVYGSSSQHEEPEGVDHMEKLSSLLETNCQTLRRNMTVRFVCVCGLDPCFGGMALEGQQIQDGGR